uniref:Uncharacterized protein n=1 Tax=Nelumbo nucifera TaxID=4432 RepID=A0A822ZLE4_NELNU|nr:TPA_asm: hypothetical protein HUJ06_003803 [Nelumbo nucifera]
MVKLNMKTPMCAILFTMSLFFFFYACTAHEAEGEKEKDHPPALTPSSVEALLGASNPDVKDANYKVGIPLYRRRDNPDVLIPEDKVFVAGASRDSNGKVIVKTTEHQD